MSTLSDHTAIRRSLIETIRLTLEECDGIDTEALYDIAETIADNLIDSDWVRGLPGVPEVPSFKFPQVPTLPNTDWWQPSPNWQPKQVWCHA